MMPTDTATVSFADVEAAARRLNGVAHRTPVLSSQQLNDAVGGTVVLKAEHLQRTGAFKFRGAYNALAQLGPDDRARGVLTYSSGNHAQGVALAGRELGMATTIIMPNNAPAIKRTATEGYGATVIAYDPEETTREDLAAELAEERGLPIIPPYDHPHIIAGQGTAGLELLQEHPDLDVLLVCCGGGGLLSGCALAADTLAPDCRVIGVEPEAGDDATRSFQTGTLQTVHNPDTIADGARTPYLGEHTFPLVLQLADDMVTVPDAALVEGMRFMATRLKQVIEPTGALALAALLSGAVALDGQKAGVLISGGNVDPETFAHLLTA
jgi:threo-3-hydroxy-L-aspartate ammonia-lyase